MHTALVTAFEPFGGRTRNRSLDAVRRLAARGVETRTLPVEFARLAGAVRPLVEQCRDALILVGESAQARTVTLEQVALNLIDARLPDNRGERPRGTRVVEDGPLALLATWPARELAEALLNAGQQVTLSAHAGTYACNAALYLALHHAASLPTPPRIGFVHVPAGWWHASDERAARAIAFLLERLTSG